MKSINQTTRSGFFLKRTNRSESCAWRLRRLLLPGLVAGLAGVLPASAQTTVWQGDEASSWFSAESWSNGVPIVFGENGDPLGSALIENGDIVNVLSPGSVVGLTSLQVSHGTLNFSDAEVNLHGFQASPAVGPFPKIEVGGTTGQSSTLQFSNGSTLTGLARSGETDSSTLHQIIAGGGVGATGHIVIKDVGTHVNATVGIGVDGPNLTASAPPAGTPLNSGTGSLTVTAGAELSGRELIVGDRRGNGTATIDDGATVNFRNIHIGGRINSGSGYNPPEGTNKGSGHVVVSGAGTVVNESSADQPGYFIALTDTAGPTIHVGYGVDEGVLEITDGATVNASIINIGHGKVGSTTPEGGSGLVRVSGANSSLNLLTSDVQLYGSFMPNSRRINEGQLHIGRWEDGKLIIAEGATVSVPVGDEPVKQGSPATYSSKSGAQVTLGLNGGHGVLQIGEGGAAGTFDVARITGGNSGEIFFNHSDTDYEFSTWIGGAAGSGILVRVESGGRTTLTGENRHLGGTLITDGTLVAGSETAFAALRVSSTDTYVGGGITVEENGTLEVASGVSFLAIAGDVTFQEGSSLAFNLALDDSSAPLFSLSDGAGTNTPSLILEGTVHLTLALPTGFDASQDYAWTFLTTEGAITGFHASSFSINLEGFHVVQGVGADANSLVLTYAAVPEPSTSLLVGLATAAFLCKRRRAHRNRNA